MDTLVANPDTAHPPSCVAPPPSPSGGRQGPKRRGNAHVRSSVSLTLRCCGAGTEGAIDALLRLLHQRHVTSVRERRLGRPPHFDKADRQALNRDGVGLVQREAIGREPLA